MFFILNFCALTAIVGTTHLVTVVAVAAAAALLLLAALHQQINRHTQQMHTISVHGVGMCLWGVWGENAVHIQNNATPFHFNFSNFTISLQFHFNFSSGGGGRGPAAASCP